MTRQVMRFQLQQLGDELEIARIEVQEGKDAQMGSVLLKEIRMLQARLELLDARAAEEGMQVAAALEVQKRTVLRMVGSREAHLAGEKRDAAERVATAKRRVQELGAAREELRGRIRGL
ncbi:hypothetical protein SS50377_26299 [Spironucleus salmonicida]|uniref:Uncharacterized protein n=1 Tax=Spironucleus salmonicida TaxID=348837 RepID=V6LUI7_9EUKA|nr:hypothetical protein SS50377_26299 [Spironucleus salmonicida]|eukprot:EST47923.1 Hypothetical protein SS50377_11984 [Spironucleus salmonicida]